MSMLGWWMVQTCRKQCLLIKLHAGTSERATKKTNGSQTHLQKHDLHLVSRPTLRQKAAGEKWLCTLCRAGWIGKSGRH